MFVRFVLLRNMTVRSVLVVKKYAFQLKNIHVSRIKNISVS